jgi:hypothetical protein
MRGYRSKSRVRIFKPHFPFRAGILLSIAVDDNGRRRNSRDVDDVDDPIYECVGDDKVRDNQIS